MIGIPLSTYADRFARVPVHLDRRPAATFDGGEAIGERAMAYLRAYQGDDATFEGAFHTLPMKALARLTRDQLCKLRHHTDRYMDETVNKAFRADPSFRLFDKIRNSAWRWGHMRRLAWNEVVDAYEGFRDFTLGVEGFETTLTMTTGNNERGWSEHGRGEDERAVYLDGVFGLLVHFRGEHVMTIGLSISTSRTILLQQVQLRDRRGNRWLFRLPANRLEFVVDSLRAAFPRHRVMVADGADLVGDILANYRTLLKEAREGEKRHRERLARVESDEERARIAGYVDERVAEKREYAGRIAHLEADRPRLAAFYRDAGRHRVDVRRPHRANGISHYRIAA